ncbi:MmgE/PrpD family protein [Salsipaludibacter albus]|uniref:MmgE/PrpD family protein n=1 Tax=Salsipaludibacter albus TaxID=2849650 RepID=UPI001EE4B148|nr:MmgE/PrpD family protein [Salsipaludibacter albus]MBY5162118.1 MmgE/PrpD family protein [Salsipaludibacter albus]
MAEHRPAAATGSGDAPLSARLAAFATDARDHGLPDEVAASVRQRILDILGICVAAARLDTSRAVVQHVADQGGAAQSSAVTLSDRVPASQAAFVNGVLAHSLDYDDTHLPSILHPSASVVPAALATAELARSGGAALQAAVAAGLEVTVRLGMAGYDRDAGNSLFFERGQHATSICGAIGAAAASALLLGLDTDGVDDAIGIAVSMASGLLEANRTGGTVKRLHCGWAAHAGVSAAQLASRGITGPPTVLEGRFGFYQGFLDGEFHPEEITDGLGDTWSVPDIHFKPYPANHFTHTGIDGAVRLRERGIGPDDVAALRLGVAAPTVRTIGEPLDVKRTPDTGYQAQFSGPYTIAAALLGGSGLALGLDDFTDELARDPQRRALMAKVDVVADPRCDERYPDELPGVLTATLTNGDEVVEEVWANRGGPSRPLDADELATKFRDNALRGLDGDAVAIIEDQVFGLGQVGDLGPVMAALRSSHG